MYILRAPHGGNFLHDLNHFLEEQVSHGTEIKPLCLSQAGLTKWMGSCLVCDSSGSPAVNGSLIPGRFAKCFGTGLHGNLTDVSPGGGNSMLEVGLEGLFFIASFSTMILFSTPSPSQRRVGSVKE